MVARIPYPDPATQSEDSRDLLAKGSKLNLLRMMSHAPVLHRGYWEMGYRLLRIAGLDPFLRELAILRVGHMTESHYEAYQHIALAQKLGLPQAKIDAAAIGSGSPAFDAREAALLRFVEETVATRNVTDATFAAAREQFSDADLVELSLVAGYYVMTAGFLKTFGIEIEEGSSIATTFSTATPHV